MLSTAMVISHLETSVLLTVGDELVASAHVISCIEARDGDAVRGSEGEGDMIACNACDQRRLFLVRGVACGVLGEDGLRFGLTTGEPVNARAKRERLEGVVFGLVGWIEADGGESGDVGVVPVTYEAP